MGGRVSCDCLLCWMMPMGMVESLIAVEGTSEHWTPELFLRNTSDQRPMHVSWPLCWDVAWMTRSTPVACS